MMWSLSPEEWTAIGTVSTAVVALATAIFAGVQVVLARRSRMDEIRPFVVIDLISSNPSRRIINLVVENIGRTLARDVRFTFDPPLETTQEQFPISESVLVTEGLPTLPPGRRIEGIFDTTVERKGSDLPLRYDVTVELNDARGKPQKPLHYVLDLAPYYGLPYVQEYGIHDAAKALREIDKTTKKWTKGARGGLLVSATNHDREVQNRRSEQFLTGAYPTLATVTPHDAWLAVAKNPFVRLILERMSRFHEWVKSKFADRQGA